jgi:hypothetical protein
LFKTARPKKLLCARTSPFLQSDRKAFEDLTVGHAERELLYPVPTSATTQAARKATPTFPIVMIIGSEVVREGESGEAWRQTYGAAARGGCRHASDWEWIRAPIRPPQRREASDR